MDRYFPLCSLLDFSENEHATLWKENFLSSNVEKMRLNHQLFSKSLTIVAARRDN